MFFVWYASFLLAVTVHEAAHGWTAKRLGDTTAAGLGLDKPVPRRHMCFEPVGLMLFPIVSLLIGGLPVGWGRAPVNSVWANHFPKRLQKVALAGPMASLGQALAAALLLHAGVAAGIFSWSPGVGLTRACYGTTRIADGVAVFLSTSFSINVLLLLLNVLPLPPLDGFTIFSQFLPPQVKSRVSALGRRAPVMFGGLLIGSLLLTGLYPVVMRFFVWLAFPNGPT